MFNFHQFPNFPTFFRKQIGQLDNFHKAASSKSHVAGDQLTLSKSCRQGFHFSDWEVFNMLKWSLFEGVKHASATRCFNAYSLHEFQRYSWPPRIFLIAAISALVFGQSMSWTCWRGRVFTMLLPSESKMGSPQNPPCFSWNSHNWGFLSHRGTPSYHPFIDWDFPWNNPSSYGLPPFMDTSIWGNPWPAWPAQDARSLPWIESSRRAGHHLASLATWRNATWRRSLRPSGSSFIGLMKGSNKYQTNARFQARELLSCYKSIQIYEQDA
jgi:hypothetical protein